MEKDVVMLDAIKGLVSSFGEAIDRNVTSDEERLTLRNQLAELESNLYVRLTQFQEEMNRGQVEINKVEAESPSFFKSAWRPAVGWIGVLGLSYQFLIHPMLEWYLLLTEKTILVGDKVVPLVAPVLNTEGIMGLVASMLGIGGYRTYEKFKGITK